MRWPLTRFALVIVMSCVFAVPGRSQPPDNAEKTSWGKGWECLAGYVERGSGCVNVAQATDAEIRRLLIRESIGSYSGSCACPYNVDRAGRACGRRSAYLRAGGATVLCYAADISIADVRRMRAQYPPE